MQAAGAHTTSLTKPVQTVREEPSQRAAAHGSSAVASLHGGRPGAAGPTTTVQVPAVAASAHHSH
jgi:hypothetical protein